MISSASPGRNLITFGGREDLVHDGAGVDIVLGSFQMTTLPIRAGPEMTDCSGVEG